MNSEGKRKLNNKSTEVSEASRIRSNFLHRLGIPSPLHSSSQEKSLSIKPSKSGGNGTTSKHRHCSSQRSIISQSISSSPTISNIHVSFDNQQQHSDNSDHIDDEVTSTTSTASLTSCSIDSSLSWSLNNTCSISDSMNRKVMSPVFEGKRKTKPSEPDNNEEKEEDEEEQREPPSNEKLNVTFVDDSQTKVHFIPSRFQYSTSTLKHLWYGKNEANNMIRRNMLEYEYEDMNWQNAVEEEGFVTLESGQVIHPVHVLTNSRYYEEQEELYWRRQQYLHQLEQQGQGHCTIGNRARIAHNKYPSTQPYNLSRQFLKVMTVQTQQQQHQQY